MRVLETALYAENLEETAAFYRDVLKLEPFTKVDGRHIFFRASGMVILLFRPSATILPPALDARLPVPPHGAVGQG
ncbi:MAG: VOC family protein, partial [Pseudomonadota bacterium]